ncbi:arylsulfotransferase family protein [bacterium]|nr:arylsulfotransferase family protein [bacterium]
MLRNYSFVLLILCNLLISCNKTPEIPEKQPITETLQNKPAQNLVLQAASEPFQVDRETQNQLEALGYMGGYDQITDDSGIILHHPKKTCPGKNLVVSGHNAEVYLMNNNGKTIHKWVCPRNKAFPETPRTLSDTKSRSFRRAYVLPDGSLLGIYNGTGMVRLSMDSTVIWTQNALCHHDLCLSPDKDIIYTFFQEKCFFAPVNATTEIMDENIAILDCKTGRLFRKISILNAFNKSVYAPYLKKIPLSGDTLHANTIRYVHSDQEKLLPIYQEGHLLISLRNMDAIALINPGTARIHWAQTGMWSYQHEPTILDNGNILLFDNAGHHGRSKVMEFNPLTQQIVWKYTGSFKAPLYSSTSGSCSRLPNGNTIIVESNRGRAIEVAPDGQIVWEFMNPDRWGPQHNLRATLFDLQRIPDDYFTEDFLSAL